MTSEAGEVAGKVKKLIRDGEDVEGFELKKIAIASEIGDVLWYCAMMAKEVGVPLNDNNAGELEKSYIVERNVEHFKVQEMNDKTIGQVLVMSYLPRKL